MMKARLVQDVTEIERNAKMVYVEDVLIRIGKLIKVTNPRYVLMESVRIGWIPEKHGLLLPLLKCPPNNLRWPLLVPLLALRLQAINRLPHLVN